MNAYNYTSVEPCGEPSHRIFFKSFRVDNEALAQEQGDRN